MRLLHLLPDGNIQLEECLIPPPYAILSHRWEAEEVTLQEFSNPESRNKRGYEKIKNCCLQAKKDGYSYTWVDTCCIDKTSSAELSESINSMFKWYRNSRICYAYLSDIEIDPKSKMITFRIPESPNYSPESPMHGYPNRPLVAYDPISPTCSIPETFDSDGEADNISSLKKPGKFSALFRSQWFSRGWTLQELLAPKNVVFYSADWQKLDTKVQLVDELSYEVGIDREALQGKTLESFSVANRMSWVSRRNTTREEDLAYCLLGIFNVNMPLLYGEGGVKAFIRLQEEIIKACDDRSLFAWSVDSFMPWEERRRGLLAESPSWFGYSRSTENYWSISRLHPATVVNLGIKIQLPITDLGDYAIGWLNCQVETTHWRGELGIFLKKVDGGRDDEYLRVHGGILGSNEGWLAIRDLHHSTHSSVETKEIFVLHKPPLRSLRGYPSSRKQIHLDLGSVPEAGSAGCRLILVHPATQWQPENYRMVREYVGESTWATGYLFKKSGLNDFCLVVHWKDLSCIESAPEQITAFITRKPRRTSLRLELPVNPSIQGSKAKTAVLRMDQRLVDVSTMIPSPGIVAVASLKAEVKAILYSPYSSRPLPKIVSVRVSVSVVDEQELEVTSFLAYIQLNLLG
jgi:hypothetical protein